MGRGASDGKFPNSECLRNEHESVGDLPQFQFRVAGTLDEDSDIERLYVIGVKAPVIHIVDKRMQFGKNHHVDDIPRRGEQAKNQRIVYRPNTRFPSAINPLLPTADCTTKIVE